MTPLKSIALFVAVNVFAGPVFAEAVLSNDKSRLYEADYEAVLAENGIEVGAAVYGSYDASYDIYLTDADLFPPLLGKYDADYEVVLDYAAFAPVVIASR
ncbi:hypothetical protein C7964_101631 [Loktanella sp. PT4BL]|uniref:hypothetical protein n=1 Tax=Loktanella sp. PT4BL TaxID=2135611 RepID=UPI000D760DF0|nr:hypothetical protein [Loktanella sp. PT4BL]PXW72519.1 hypothetical protein C7964_101631 [Loktanella sp. PT4BL]